MKLFQLLPKKLHGFACNQPCNSPATGGIIYPHRLTKSQRLCPLKLKKRQVLYNLQGKTLNMLLALSEENCNKNDN